MILCHEVIWLTATTSTYCMRERGHAGKHNIENCEPFEEKKNEETKIQDEKRSLL